MFMKKNLFIAVLALCGIASAETVFDADFQGSASGSSNLLNATEANREIILNNGTATGSWDDNNTTPVGAYEIAEDESGNKVMLFTHHNSEMTPGEAYFSSVASLSGGELSVDWDWMYTCVGKTSQIWFELLDSSSNVIASVKLNNNGKLTLDDVEMETGLGNFLAYDSVLSTNNWDPLSMNLTLSAAEITLSAGANTYASVPGVYTDVAGIRLRMKSIRDFRPSGWWIDNIKAETSVSSSATLVLNPADQIDIALTAPATTETGTFDVSYIPGPSGTNVVIESIIFSNETVSGSFTNLDSGSFPLSLADPSPSNETLTVQFDNTVAGLSHNDAATGTVGVAWYEAGGSTTNTSEVLVVATYDNAPAALLLDPSDQLDISLFAPATLAEGTVDASFVYGTASSNNVDVTGVTFSDPGSFSSLDSFPINLTDPSPSNETLTIQYDNSISNLSSIGESASGTMLVSWTEVGSGITNSTELPIVATYYPPMVVNWSGTEIVTSQTNASRAAGVFSGADGSDSWSGWAFDSAGDPLFDGLLKPELAFTGGAVAYSTNAGVAAAFDRYRVADQEPDDGIWFRQNKSTSGFSVASAYLWEPTQSVTLGDVTGLTAKFQNMGASGSEARLLITTGGSNLVSETLGWTAVGTFNLTSISNLTWAAYEPGDLSDGGTNTQSNMDMRFATAISGGYSMLPASSELTRIGLAADVIAANGDKASYYVTQFQVIIPASSGFESWVAGYGLSGSPDADADYDYDLDGLDNLAEYGLGGDPTTKDAAAIVPVAAVVNDAGTDWFYHIHNERTDDPSLTFTVQANPNLTSGTWATNGVDFVGETGESGGFKTVTNRTDIGSEEFIRLRIEQN